MVSNRIVEGRRLCTCTFKQLYNLVNGRNIAGLALGIVMLHERKSFRYRVTVHAFVLVIAGTFINCGSPPGAMAGTWAFNFISHGSLEELRATATLSQSGDQVTGTVTFNGAAGSCAQSTSIAGTITGNSLQLQFSSSPSILTLAGKTNSAFTTASGTYALTGPLCLQPGGTGTWSAVFIAS